MAHRTPVTIVILAWNTWSETEACLESLFPTLGVRDEVVVVDNGSRDATPERLADYPWLRTLTNPENRGFAAGCNQGAAVATREIIVFLNNDTFLSGAWIDRLVEPLGATDVVAAGPRSNFVSGPQLVPAVDYHDRPSLDAFVEAWGRTYQGQVESTNRLVGFCLAVKASAFRSIGGFDEGYDIGGYEDDDLCRRLVTAGGALMIAHASYVHHSGHRTFDANGVDWACQELHNRERFLAKFAEPAARESDPAAVLRDAAALVGARRMGDAAALLAGLVADPEFVGEGFSALADLLAGTPGLLAGVHVALDEAGKRRFLAKALALPPAAADRLLEGCSSALPGDAAVLAAGATLAAGLPVERAIVWSGRLRGAGYVDACPLLASGGRSREEQNRAAAAAYALFGDKRAEAALRAELSAALPWDDATLPDEIVAGVGI